VPGQQWEQLATELRAQPPTTPGDYTVRLLTFAVIVLGQRRVNKRGRCQFCSWSQWAWRFWHQRPQCMICRTLEFVLSQDLSMTWWHLFTSTGKNYSVTDVRRWLEATGAPSTPCEPH
jgi:hypothetical protein